MKRLTQCLMLALALAITPTTLLTGCKSVATTSYKTTGVTAATVDAAMRAWGDFVAKNRLAGTPVPDGQRLAVANAFAKYQLAFKAVTDAGVAYSQAAANPNDPTVPVVQQNLVTATTILGAAIGDLTELIQSFGVKL